MRYTFAKWSQRPEIKNYGLHMKTSAVVSEEVPFVPGKNRNMAMLP